MKEWCNRCGAFHELNTAGCANYQLELKTYTLKEENDRLKYHIATLNDFIMDLKIGNCWCEVGIGNPNYKDHSAICKKLQDLYE